MTCPVCGERRARRACPALGRQICAVCCGTKRQTEIRCPDTCGYLTTARQHPPAAVQRQHERDLQALAPTMGGLTHTQQQVGFLLLSVVSASGRADTLDRVTDADVAEAAAALAGTYETASKGVIYEHRAASLPAQRLVHAFREMLEHLSREAQAVRVEREASVALRAIERGVRDVMTAVTGEPRAYIELVQRLIRPYEPPVSSGSTREEPRSGLILPGV
jgi:hypothetical protein